MAIATKKTVTSRAPQIPSAPPKKSAEKEKPLPKSLAACGDILYETRQQRLLLNKEVDKLEKLESRIKEHLIKSLPKSQASGISGKVAHVEVKTEDIPQVEDWDKFYAHIRKTGEFDLLGRRLSTEAVEARWAAKKKVPGVGVFKVTKVACTKV